MTHVWRLLTLEARRKPGPDVERFMDLALTFYFYWVNFGPLSRGTAACGYVAFFALMLSIGYEIQVPRGRLGWGGVSGWGVVGWVDAAREGAASWWWRRRRQSQPRGPKSASDGASPGHTPATVLSESRCRWILVGHLQRRGSAP